MSHITTLFQWHKRLLKQLSKIEFVVPLALRLILAPTLIIAGYNKLRLGESGIGFIESLGPAPSAVAWFGNADWGLGLPFPELMVTLAAWTEFAGGWLLLIGLFNRLISIPLAFTMLIAALTAHWSNGWFAIAPSNPDTSAAQVYAWLGVDAASQSLENSKAVGQRLQAAKSLLQEHGHYDWLTEKGNYVVLNNGIEFAAMYFVMLLTLVFMGGGRWFSVDDWLRRWLQRGSTAEF